MAEPLLELDASLTATPTVYDQVIINAGAVDGTVTLRWGDADSASEAITNVTRPSSGDAWAPELWRQDSDAADTLIQDSDETPSGTQRPMMFNMTSDAVAFATKPRITIYDSTAHTSGGEEVTTGTTNHTSPLIKGRIQTVNTAPTGLHWNETTEVISHALGDTPAGAIVPAGVGATSNNAGLDGDNEYLEASVTNINTTPQFFSIALSVPDDVTPGADSIDCVLSVRYTFT